MSTPIEEEPEPDWRDWGTLVVAVVRLSKQVRMLEERVRSLESRDGQSSPAGKPERIDINFLLPPDMGP